MPLLDYTTSVPVSKTISQIQAKLVEHGARAVMMEYDDWSRIKALAFKVRTPHEELPIRLPIDAAATLKVLQKQHYNGEIPARYANMAKGQTTFDPYQILELERSSSDEEVKRRYRELLWKLHPDTAGVEGTAFLLQMVLAAYEMIKQERR